MRSAKKPKPRSAKKSKPPAEHQQEQNAGRPRIEIDLVQLERLATIQCTDEEIAAVLGISHDTIARRKADDPEFLRVLTDGRSKGKATLRRIQWQRANAGSDTMCIWLGKNLLGQKDKLAHTGGDDDDKPVSVEMVYRWESPKPDGD